MVLATRRPLTSAGLVRWRARGEVLEIRRAALAFTPAEIAALFREIYGLPLPPADLAALADDHRGLAHRAATGLAGAAQRAWPAARRRCWPRARASLGALFDYLARDVLGAQPPDVAAFLRDTAVLRELTPAACAAVTGAADSAGSAGPPARPRSVRGRPGRRGTTATITSSTSSCARRPPPIRRARGPAPARRAPISPPRGDEEEAIYHWLAAGDLPAAAAAIERAGEAALRAGWLDTVARWIDALPPAVLADHPLLQAFLGDVYRLRSRFDDGAGLVRARPRPPGARATTAPGISRALRGQALVYLDTVRPAQAERLLEEALRLADGAADRAARARLLELLAENKLNMGKPDEAERLRAEARALREEGPGEDTLSVRVKLRTGQLDEAQRT